MEGIGYWIFLLALYLISTLAKKRKQKKAWETLDKEEENQGDTSSQPDFIEQFFGDLVSKEEKPIVSDDEPEPEEVYPEEEIPIETESIPSEVQADYPIHLSKRMSPRLMRDMWEQFLTGICLRKNLRENPWKVF